MPTYRQKMAIQKKHKQLKPTIDYFIPLRKENISEVKTFINKTISMYRTAASSFEPYSDEEKYCMDEVMKYTADLDILEHGTYEERKEVVNKYGQCIDKAIYKGRV